MDYIIVQAGGKGTRLEYLTGSKPKALVPVYNLPILFHLFRKFPDKHFIVIADYKKEVMHRYLSAFADVRYIVVEAEGSGTCAGLHKALELIPDHECLMYIWSDLILPADFELPEDYQDGQKAVNDYIGISGTFPCRWKYENGQFLREPSVTSGLAGLFLFTEKSKLSEVPDTGGFARWLQASNRSFKTVRLDGTREFGLLSEYEKLEKSKTRPYNRITRRDEIVTKEPIDPLGVKVADNERKWYQKAEALHIGCIPKIYGTDPLRMEYIHGKNLYDVSCSLKEKETILEKDIETLQKLHSAETAVPNYFSLKETYYSKTMSRLSHVRDLVPFADRREITVNGRPCRNIFFYRRDFERKVSRLRCPEFVFIHGDPTFSNTLMRETGELVYIDPRGYFGETRFLGDVRYDWAKLYFSLKGNFDQFNLKRFRLEIGGSDGTVGTALPEGEVRLSINSNGWEELEENFFRLTGSDPDEIRLINAVIWLSLTTHTWVDYDSVCGSFYNGLYYLESVL